MTTLTINDINTTINHEPRIQDLKLAEFLGFAQTRDIRKLIERHKDALEKLGGSLRHRGANLIKRRSPCHRLLPQQKAVHLHHHEIRNGRGNRKDHRDC